jgi:hypothetical protein
MAAGPRGYELDLIAVGVDQVGGVMVGPAGVRVLVRKHERPAMEWGGTRERVDITACTRMEGEMVEPRAATLVTAGDHRGRLFDH